MEYVLGLALVVGLFTAVPIAIKKLVERVGFDPVAAVTPTAAPHSAGSASTVSSPRTSANGKHMITVRGWGYQDVVQKVAAACAEQARHGRVLVDSRQGTLRLLSGGGIGSAMSWDLYFKDAPATRITAPVGAISVEVVRFSKGIDRRDDKIAEIEAAGGTCWFTMHAVDQWYPFDVIGYEMPVTSPVAAAH